MKKTVFLSFIIGFLLLHNNQCFANKTNIQEQAKWIGFDSFKHDENQWFNLRKTIVLKEKPKKAIARISVDSKYWLWINGEMITREGGIKRGPNPKDSYYDEIDFSDKLKKGKNTIAVLAWYFGREGFSHKDSKHFGFFFDGRIDNTKVISDTSWKIQRDSAYQHLLIGKPGNFRLPESNVKYSANNETSNWMAEDFNDKAWSMAAELFNEGEGPWGSLVKRRLAQWKDFGLKKVNNLTVHKKRVAMKLPYNMQFSFWFKVRAKAGATIDITMDSHEWLNDTPLRAKYVAKDGIQTYEHLPWLSGHEVYFDLNGNIEILEAGYRETGYASEFDGKMSIDDTFITRLMTKANRTLYINMRDTFMDCPDRERAQWWGDLVLLMEESFYAMDNDAHELSRKAIRELVDWQKQSGVLFSPIPAGNWDKELPQQMLAAIALGFKNYAMYTGDIETYKYTHNAVKKYLKLWNVDKSGHVNFKEGGWNWSDWGDKVDAELLEQAWYYMALTTYADISKYVGDTNEQQWATQLAKKIKLFVNQNYWTVDGYKSTNYKHQIDDRGNGLMVVAGIAEKSKFEKIAEILKQIRNSSPYIDKYQLEALFIMDKGEQAIARIKERYKVMVDSELTTLWELFTEGDWSYNHGWSGGALTMMYKYVAGIKPTKMGFEEFEVQPNAVGYKEFATNFSTVRGKVSLEYQEDDANVTMRLLVPKGSTAIVHIPFDSTNIQIEHERDKKNIPILKTRTDKNQTSMYQLKEGVWQIHYQQSH